MTIRSLSASLALVGAALLAGCAAPVQRPLGLPANYLSDAPARTGRIGVVMANMPKPDTQFPGANCLLCMGVASMANSALTTQVQGLNTDALKALPADLVELLRKARVDAVLITDPLDFSKLPDLKPVDDKARKDFSALKLKHKVDRLLVVSVESVGVRRSYSGYIPTDLPAAVLNGEASLVDLGSNTLEWYLPLKLVRRADGNWDESPMYPALTQAYYQVPGSAADMVKKPFTP